MARIGMKCLHGVVEHEPQPLHHNSRCGRGQRMRKGHRRTPPHPWAEIVCCMGGLHRSGLGHLDRLSIEDLLPPSSGVVPRQKDLLHRDILETGIAQVPHTVGEGRLLGQSHSVKVLRRTKAHPGQVEPFQDVQYLARLYTTARWGQPCDRITPVFHLDRFAYRDLVSPEVFFCQESSVFGEVLGDLLGHPTLIEHIRPVVRYLPQGAAVVRVPKRFSRCEWRPVGLEVDLSGGWCGADDIVHPGHAILGRRPSPESGQLAGDHEPLLSQPDGRLDELFPRQGTIPSMGLP